MNINEKGIDFNVIGLGHAGSKLAQEFSKLGYRTMAINSSPQDLFHIVGPIRLGLSDTGAGKDLLVAKKLFKEKKTVVLDKIKSIFPIKDYALLIAGLGGGTGSGSITLVASFLRDIGYKEVSTLVVLPLEDEGPGAMKNTLFSLKEISESIANGIITSCIIADNSRMFELYPQTNISEFWPIANREIVKPLDAFNKLCTLSTNYTAIDSADFRKIITSKGCITFGKSILESYDKEAILDMSENHFKSSLMATGFDFYSAEKSGVIILGQEAELSKIPKESESLIINSFKDYIHGGVLFNGIYETTDSKVSIYSIIAGLGVPYAKVQQLKEDYKSNKVSGESKEFKVDSSAFDIE